MRAYIAIDNGVSGSLAFVSDYGVFFAPTPVKQEQSYTKAKAKITRVDVHGLTAILLNWMNLVGHDDIRVFLERPYVNPTGFKATASALRALEATLIALEALELSLEYVDSRQWQKAMLPSGCAGKELKTVSHDIGIRMFPGLMEQIRKHGDADSLLMAEWAKREGR